MAPACCAKQRQIEREKADQIRLEPVTTHLRPVAATAAISTLAQVSRNPHGVSAQATPPHLIWFFAKNLNLFRVQTDSYSRGASSA